MRRVAITGAGTVNPLAGDVAGTFAALREGRCAIGPLDIRGVERLTQKIGAAVRRFDPSRQLAQTEIAQCDRFAQFALIAARQAMAQSGLAPDEDLAPRSGVILGTAGGGLATADEGYRRVYAEGRDRVSPLTVPKLMHNAAASQLSMTFGFAGPTFSIASACASSNHAMGLAFQLVRSGAAPAMLTGGAEAMLTFGGLKAWEGLRVMSPDACRPFSANRNGMVMGEGAAIFVFEDWDRARARGAEILAEVAGFGMGSDAADLVAPSADGATRAMQAALADAGLNPDDVGYVNAHGTGTRLNDASECAAIRKAFGGAAERLALSSTKSMHGHLIGATGAVELLACLMALRDGVIAPTVGHQAPDPDCALDVVPNAARERQVGAALSNAFGFGGLNAVLALKRA